jgi:hypothetical protein
VSNQTSTPATGSVTFYDGDDRPATVDLNSATPDLATLKIKKLAVGRHKFAVYGGDSANAASMSSSLTIRVVQGR